MKHERECLCGSRIPVFGDHEGFEPTCRHCKRIMLNYMMRELDINEHGHN